MTLADNRGFNSLDDVTRYAYCAKCDTKPKNIICETDADRDCRIFFIECHGSRYRVEISYLDFISLPRHRLMEKLVFPNDRNVSEGEHVMGLDSARPGHDVSVTAISVLDQNRNDSIEKSQIPNGKQGIFSAVTNVYERERDRRLENLRNWALENMRLNLEKERQSVRPLPEERRELWDDDHGIFETRLNDLNSYADKVIASGSETLLEAALRRYSSILGRTQLDRTREETEYSLPLERDVELDEKGRVIRRIQGVPYTLSDIAENFNRIHNLIAGMRCDKFLVSEEIYEAVHYLIEKISTTGLSLAGFEKKPNWLADGPIAWRNIGICDVVKYKKNEPYRLDMSSVPFIYYNKNNVGMDIYPDWLNTDEVRRQRVSGITEGSVSGSQDGPSRKIVIED